jgi:hypothetical protein
MRAVATHFYTTRQGHSYQPGEVVGPGDLEELESAGAVSVVRTQMEQAPEIRVTRKTRGRPTKKDALIKTYN